VRDGALRYLRFTNVDPPIERLFDASADPRELEDRAPERADDVARLRAIADGYLASPPHWGEAPHRELEELELNQLRALGYAVP